jgi:hypothetical protein
MCNRGKWVKEMRSTLEKEMYKAGIDEFEVEMLLDKAVEDNNIDCLPSEIKEKYWLEDCFVEYEITDEKIEELKRYVIGTVKAIENKDIRLLAKNMKNVLQSVTEVKYSIISQIKAEMLEMGADGSMMSGSGPSVFGIFTDKEAGKACYNHFIKKDNIKTIHTEFSW